MLIDWFTVAAQLVNFLILVWLLRRFLYLPVLKAIDERERKITAELAHAASVEEEAAKARTAWEKKNADFDRLHGEMLRQAADEADRKRAELLASAKLEYAGLQERLQEALRKEEHERQGEAIRRIRGEVFALAGKVLEELADSTLEERIVAVFCKRLQESGADRLADMSDALREPGARAVLRSSFELPAALRRQIEEQLGVLFGADVHPACETSSEELAGIELCVNGNCIAWNLGTALDALEKAAVSEPEAAEEGRPT
jgi:F-type H+-transporting ATPase subunit b